VKQRVYPGTLGRPAASNVQMTHAISLPHPGRARPGAYDLGMHDIADQALAARAARGDTAAFEELVVRHQDRLYTLALRVTGSDADARDCVQEGLIAAWRGMPRFRGDAQFSTWLHRIVLRKAYDAIDQRRRRPEPVEEVAAVAPGSDPGIRSELLDALAALELEFRVVAVACDILGMSMDEAGALLDLPAGTVKSRLHRARARLAEAIGSEATT
jgi:RNA polymerase sigma-70 factor (ECF subfamily)